MSSMQPGSKSIFPWLQYNHAGLHQSRENWQKFLLKDVSLLWTTDLQRLLFPNLTSLGQLALFMLSVNCLKLPAIVFISSDLGWNTLAGGKHTYYRSGSSCTACVPCVKLPTVHRLQLHLRLSQRKQKKTKPNTLQIPSQNTNKITTNCRGVHCRRQQHKPQKWKSENPVTPLAN